MKKTLSVLSIALVALIAMALGFASSGDAKVPPRWVWTESYAEKMLLKKLHVPCKIVRQNPSVECDVTQAQAELDKFNADMADAIARCDALPLGSQEG